MTLNKDLPRQTVFRTQQEIAMPHGIYVQVIRDAWWPTTEDGKVALYIRRGLFFAQCNSNPNIAHRIRAHPSLTGPVVQIQLAFIEHRCDT